MNDEKIIELYFSRSENAISETDKKYGTVCRGTAYNILYSHEDSEECVNDTYLRLWEAIPPARPGRLGAFIIRIVRNTALDLLRSRGRIKNGSGCSSVDFDEISGLIPAADTVESAADRNAVIAAVERFLAGLPREKRIMFVQRYFYCSSYRDIAHDLNTTEGRVTMTLRRTREKLRKFLEKEGIEV